jgi:hypothetical protein
MNDGEIPKHANTMEISARRFYLRNLTKTPKELFGSKMEKEKYLNALTEKMLPVIGIKPQQS